jgi:hypothetical protein
MAFNACLIISGVAYIFRLGIKERWERKANM